jgi:hypothetical protein
VDRIEMTEMLSKRRIKRRQEFSLNDLELKLHDILRHDDFFVRRIADFATNQFVGSG